MSKYNFDQIIDRSGTRALKTDVLKERFGCDKLIPLWVADMDFLSPPAITEAIIERAKHGVFGYTCPCDEYYNSITNWVARKHDWQIKREWISFIPGIVKGIAFVIDCFSTQEDSIIIQPPVYHPFKIVPTLHHRTIVENTLVLEAGQYRMDIADLKKKINSDCKILILCNPHNPGGRVWTREELIDLAEICYDNNILVISDEIHSDLAYDGHKHVPFASVSEKAAQNSITFMAPSKTFNIAGIVSSFSVIPNEALRNKFHEYLKRSELEEGHIFAYLAAQIAYTKCDDWLDEVKSYLWESIQFVDNYLKENIPQIKAIIPEASFLVWLDCRELNLSQDDLVSLFVKDAHLALNDGSMFGEEGKGFMRLNIGSPRATIEKALNNLKEVLNR
jgi:cystathionine beta-lyase